MSFSNDDARQKNKYNGSELYNKYLVDEENGKRHSLTRMTEYSSCYYLCLTPNYKKVKRFTCNNCCLKDKRDGERACPYGFQVKFIEKYNIDSMRILNLGCIRGRPWEDYYKVSGLLFSEIFKIKEGEYWIRYNREAHKLWQSVYVSSDDWHGRPTFIGSQGR